MTNATPIPASSHGVRSTVRSGTRSSPTAKPRIEKSRRPLVEEGDADECAHHQPEPRVAAVEQADDEQRDRAPQQDLRRDRGEEVPDREQHRRDCGRDRRSHLRPCVTTELSREQRRQQDETPVQQRRQDPQPQQRGAEQGVADSVEERSQRRMIDVAPRESPSGRQVIELVAVIAVDGRGRDVEHDDDQRNEPRRACEVDAGHRSPTSPAVTSWTTVACAMSSGICAPS